MSHDEALYNTVTLVYFTGWWRGVVASVVRRMNEVTLRRARLVLGWVTVFGRVYVTSQLGQLSLASLRCIPPASAGVKAGMSPLPRVTGNTV